MATNIGYLSNTNGTNFMLVTNGEFLRRVDSVWNKIRVGIRLSWKEFSSSELGQTTPSSIPGNPRFYVGMCNYDRGGVAAQNSAMHFVGARSSSTTFARNSNGGATGNIPYYSVNFQTLKREVNVFTAGTSGAASSLVIYGLSNYFMFSVDVDKSNPNTTVVSVFSPNNATTGIYNVTQAQFLTAMEAAVPAMTGYAYSSLAPVVINEATNGVLDAVNIYWGRSRAQVVITDVWYSIIA